MSTAATSQSLVYISVMTVAGMFLVWLGRYVKRTQDVTLIAGARGTEITDPRGLTRLVGNVAIVSGAATIAVGLLDPLVGPTARPALLTAYLAGLLGLAAWARARSGRYVE
jgi:hypothetical protein